MPRDPDLGIIDWDDPRAWNADAAVDTIVKICEQGYAEVPVYSIAADRATNTRHFDIGTADVFVAEGLFAAEIVAACQSRDVLAEALLVHRPPWLNFFRRLFRDLAEHRKPPLTLLLRGRALMRAERAILDRQTALGARPVTATDVRRRLSGYAHTPHAET